MSVESLLPVLEWAVPGGIVAALTWLLSREVRQASTAKKVHDTYREMYEDVSATLSDLRHDYDKIYKICTRMERALSRASVCRYWAQCPVRDELPQHPFVGQLNVERPRPAVRHRARDTSYGDDSGSPGLGGSEDLADEPP